MIKGTRREMVEGERITCNVDGCKEPAVAELLDRNRGYRCLDCMVCDLR